MTEHTPGTRQRAGGLLLYGYTFKGKLGLCLIYDESVFGGGQEGDGVVKRQRSVEEWWEEVLRGVDEFLINGKA